MSNKTHSVLLLFSSCLVVCFFITRCGPCANTATSLSPTNTIQVSSTAVLASTKMPELPKKTVTATPTLIYTDATPTMEPIGYLTINSKPSGAKIVLDNNIYGVTPFTQSVTAGKHNVKIQLDGFKAWQSDITIKADEEKLVNASLAYEITASKIVTGNIVWLDWLSEQTIGYAVGTQRQNSNDWERYAFDLGTMQHITQTSGTFSVELSQQLLTDLQVARSPWEPEKIIGVTHVSPSGQYLLYTRLPIGYQHPTPLPESPYSYPVEVWISKVDGTNPRRLGEVNGAESLIANWSRDEQYVSITDPNRLGSAAIYLARVDGSLYTWLGQDPSDMISSLTFSPNGRFAVYGRNGKELRLLTLKNLETVKLPLPPGSLTWSLDKNCLYSFHIYYYKNDAETGIYRYCIDTDVTDLIVTSSQIADLDKAIESTHLMLINGDENLVFMVSSSRGGHDPINSGLWILKIAP